MGAGDPRLLTVDHLLPVDLLLRQAGQHLPAHRVLPVLRVQLGLQVRELPLLVLQEVRKEGVDAEAQAGRLDAPGRVKGGGGSTPRPRQPASPPACSTPGTANIYLGPISA